MRLLLASGGFRTAERVRFLAAEMRRFFAGPGRHYCAMLRSDYDRLTTDGMRLRIIHEESGLFTTTGRALRSGARAPREQFMVVTDESEPHPGT